MFPYAKPRDVESRRHLSVLCFAGEEGSILITFSIAVVYILCVSFLWQLSCHKFALFIFRRYYATAACYCDCMSLPPLSKDHGSWSFVLYLFWLLQMPVWVWILSIKQALLLCFEFVFNKYFLILVSLSATLPKWYILIGEAVEG